MATTQADVSSRSQSSQAMVDNLQLVADLWGGTDTMRQAAQRRLLQEPGEQLRAYRIRLSRTVLFNGFKRAVRTLTGKPFNKPINIDYKGSTDLEHWCEDVDLSGRHVDIFIRDFTEMSIADGIRGILVEMPPKPKDEVTLADQKKNNRRPYFVDVDFRNVLGWRFETINGVQRLTQLRIMETITEPDGDFGETSTAQVRVLTPGHWALWRPDPNQRNRWVLYLEGDTSLDFIPFVPVYTGRTDFMRAVPPLLDLMFLNVQHWQSGSDQQHILHVARVPLLCASGWPTEEGSNKQAIGPGVMIKLPDPQAKVYYVEHQGHAIEAGRKDLEDIENRMAIMGVELLVKKQSGAVTATQNVNDTIKEDSDLQAMVRGIEDGFELALSYMLQWMSEAPDNAEPLDADQPEVTINKDFGISMRDAADLQILLQARIGGMITQETFLNELQRRGVLDPALSVTDEIDKIATEPPTLRTVANGAPVTEEPVNGTVRGSGDGSNATG